MTDRGIIYLDIGWRHQCVAAISLFTLRKHWQGPVTIFTDAQGSAIAGQIAAAANADLQLFDTGGHRAYTAKPMLPKLSPYATTIQCDTDTIWRGSPEPYFDLATPIGMVVTQFGEWVSIGPKMRGRIEGWRQVDPERTVKSLEKAWPAINTGVVAYGTESIVARKVWLEQTLKNARAFMSDELAIQLLVPEYVDRPDLLRVVDDEFNCCPRFGRRIADAKVIHFHGHGKLDRLPQYRTAWEPLFREAWACDFAGIRSWVRQGAKGWVNSFL